MTNRFLLLSALALVITNLQAQQIERKGGDPKLTEQWVPEPKIIAPGKAAQDPPADAIILLGNNLDSWEAKEGGPAKWNFDKGIMTVERKTGDIHTKQAFGDIQLHVEWRTPAEVKGDGQGRGNSGILLMGKYELQVLDSYNNRTYSNGQAGALYKQLPPLVNASRPPGEWQTYDVIFIAPRFYEDGSLQSQARITVLHNGVLIQNNASIWGGTQYIGISNYEKHPEKLPLVLQDHGNPVSFRNMWIRPL